MTRLSYYCKHCKKKNYIKAKATNRYDLKDELGLESSRHCDSCGTYETKHINRLNFEPNQLVLSIAIGVVILPIIFSLFFGVIATIGFAIPVSLYFNEQNKTTNRNKVKIRR